MGDQYLSHKVVGVIGGTTSLGFSVARAMLAAGAEGVLVTGSMIINMLRCATAEKLVVRGYKPVLLPSHQFIGTPTAHAAEEQLEAFYEAYRKSLTHLYQ